MELISCSGQCHVEQSSLFVDVIGLVGMVNRHESLFKPGEVHHRPLKTLRRVERDDLNGVATSPVLASER